MSMTGSESLPRADHDVEHHLQKLLNALSVLQSRHTQSTSEIEELRDQLDIERRGYRSMKQDYKENLSKERKTFKEHIYDLEQKNAELEERLASLESATVLCQDSDRPIPQKRIVCLIDGDSTMIAPRYIKKGRRGGQEAADELSLHISNYLIEEYGESSSSVELAFMCLLDKNNYANTIESFGLPTTADRLGEFITGFNHAGGDFLMADVGPASSHEATQKLKDKLWQCVRSPDVWKIFLTPGHDDQYLDNLTSLNQSGFDKIVLLPACAPLSSNINSLGLPSLMVDALCKPDALPISPTSPSTVRPWMMSLTPPLSFVQLNPMSHDISYLRRNAETGMQGLHLLKPSPCHLHYLADCRNPTCSFGHHWVLSQVQLEELRKWANAIPCKSAIRKPCPHGNRCIYGHKCPHGQKCATKSKAKCKFSAAGMHDG
ncbi:unnamed protein product [Somion occarium]|uniref:C3H1-type domain-containing protein n=1 Tax=Somion occarium TaxID=3059160 RepID=A0ABP1DJ19_9APHY